MLGGQGLNAVIKRTEMEGHFECWAAKDSTLCKHCTGPRGPNGIETRNIHVNGVTKCDARDWGNYCHGAVEFFGAVLALALSCH